MKTNDQNHEKIKLSFSQIFKSIRDKISKITYFKVRENKSLNETEFIIRGENKMIEGIAKKGKTKKEPKLHPEIKQFMEEQRKFNQSQNEKWEKQDKTNKEIKQFMEEQRKFNQTQIEKWAEQDKTNKEIKKFIKEQTQINKDVKKFIANQQETNQVLLTSIKEILLRLERIEKCPTIKKELDELE